MILTFIKMNVRPEKRKELRQTIRSIVQEVRKENGCVDSTFYQNSENENDFFLFEECVRTGKCWMTTCGRPDSRC